jgi:O-antigen biosynthesis protein
MTRAKIIQNYSAVTAACIMTKKSVFNTVEGFNIKFVSSYNDIDFCLKVREKGYLIIWTPYSELYHYESRTRGYNTTKKKKETYEKELTLFKEKWKDVIEKGDPYYNPNLSTEKEDFSLNIKWQSK